MIEIRKGTEEDLEGFIALLDAVKRNMDHDEWFYLDPPDALRKMMQDGIMEFWVALDGEKMAGAFDVLHPEQKSLNYGYAIGLSEDELPLVVNMDSAAVHPAYRGQGLQRRLMQIAEEDLLSRKEKRILLCTVHPDNRFSLRNVLSQGYRVVKSIPIYGSVRHVLCKVIE